MSQSLPLSIAIIARDEAHNLPRTLAALQDLAAEVIVMDSGSTDDTVKIAESYGAKVIHQDWLGYIEQKNAVFAACTQPWILSLDSDEALTPALREELVSVLSNPEYDGYLLPRKTIYLSRLMQHSWQPDLTLRLVRRDAQPKWVGQRVHERLTIQGKVGQLQHYARHYSYRDLDEHMRKTLQYAKLVAEAKFEQGKRASLLNFIFNPLFAFLKMYVFRLGCLDGLRGLLAAKSAVIYAFMKYAYLWELQQQDQS